MPVSVHSAGAIPPSVLRASPNALLSEFASKFALVLPLALVLHYVLDRPFVLALYFTFTKPMPLHASF